MRYPAHFEPCEEGGFTVTFRDVPQAVTEGDDESEALANAADALATALEIYAEDGRDWPAASKARRGERMTTLDAVTTLKLALARLVARERMPVAELARRMDYKSETAARRLLSLRHTTKAGELERALSLFGMTADVQVVAA